jgi:hypothetical protein
VAHDQELERYKNLGQQNDSDIHHYQKGRRLDL